MLLKSPGLFLLKPANANKPNKRHMCFQYALVFNSKNALRFAPFGDRRN